MSDPKQVIVLRNDLNMRKGKMVAQGAHASMAALLNMGGVQAMDHGTYDYFVIPMSTPAIERWLLGGNAVPPSGFKKICVSVNSEAELLSIHERGLELNLPCALIKDNGLTEFGGVPTYTAVAVGPADPEVIDSITGHLKLL